MEAKQNSRQRRDAIEQATLRETARQRGRALRAAIRQPYLDEKVDRLAGRRAIYGSLYIFSRKNLTWVPLYDTSRRPDRISSLWQEWPSRDATRLLPSQRQPVAPSTSRPLRMQF